MKKLIKTLALITVIVAAVKAFRRARKTYTITSLDDELLVDISSENIIQHKSVKVYVDGKLT
ncbi:MAG: hypothetical protein ABS939_22650 [Psychrobacillus sp.]